MLLASRRLVVCWLAASAIACGDANIPTKTNPLDNTVESVVNIVPATDSRITVMGRTTRITNDNLLFAYPGVTLTLNVTSRTANLLAHSTSEQSYLEIIIDEQAPQVIKLSRQLQTIPLFTDAERNEHRVEIIHRSETWHGMVTVAGFEIIDGDLLAPPALAERRLLILGDSVTCGEAIERHTGCEKNSRWWNPRLSYGMLTAEALNAQVHLVCYGGRGLVRSWNGKTDDQNLADFFELAVADPKMSAVWDHSRFIPDVILSAIGTNDFSQGIPERGEYITTYIKLIHRLRELHPKAQIALTEGAILNGGNKETLQAYLNEIAQRLDDPYIHVLPSVHYPGDECDSHPTKAQHAAMAKDLIPLLSPLFN